MFCGGLLFFFYYYYMISSCSYMCINIIFINKDEMGMVNEEDEECECLFEDWKKCIEVNKSFCVLVVKFGDCSYELEEVVE